MNQLSLCPQITGQLRHYCLDWDDLLIDEYSPEFAACTCDWNSPTKQALNIIWRNIYAQEGVSQCLQRLF